MSKNDIPLGYTLEEYITAIREGNTIVVDEWKKEVTRLQERVKKLEEGIRKHKTESGSGPLLNEIDAELYKLLEK